ncbi:CBS domain-containing protein [Natronolimnohabitans innermongolicus]|uniref:Signal transduction protein with CBS domains n=1 Tax=Natronolimnohabitans innermongolicus JCM 12255 TaxID=1227499 RepID=L9WSZ8_9EURY|nr:CBS domain-containing protein [Natronolimnohabitans innermongolicus]ELY52542.1 signal transduction protein with CBS domains [Natronolimnohabitans innermongolicus JCM 12255]
MLEIPIDDVTTPIRRPLHPETPVREAAQRLRDPDVPALVVLDAESPVGIVTESDIVAFVAETRGSHPVSAIMSAPVSTIAPSESIVTAAERMRADGVKHLVVADGETYRGLVSASTLAPSLSRRRLEIDWRGDPVRIDADEGGVISAGD